DVRSSRDDLVVEGVVEGAPARRVADVYASDRGGAERVGLAQGADLRPVEPELDEAGGTVDQHVDLELVPGARADRRPDGRHPGDLVEVGELSVRAAQDRQDGARARRTEANERGAGRGPLADRVEAAVVVELGQRRVQRLVGVGGRPGRGRPRRPGAGVGDLLLDREAARCRPLRQVAALEAVAEDEPYGTSRGRAQSDDDGGCAYKRHEGAQEVPAEAASLPEKSRPGMPGTGTGVPRVIQFVRLPQTCRQRERSR